MINILIGLLRQKLTALILGASGVGLIGLYQSLIITSAALGSLGLGTAGTRQIADAVSRDDATRVASVRTALLWTTMALAVITAAIVWFLRFEIATRMLDDKSLASAIGWLSIATGFTIASGSQIALLTGMRRIGDVARAIVYSSVLATIVGIAALVMLGERGLLLFVIATPIATFLVGVYFVAKLPPAIRTGRSWKERAPQIRLMVALGLPIMIGGFAGLLAQTLLRIIVQRELSLVELGYFQAAATLSMTYLGFVLQAMSTDYYPRLTAAIHDREAARRIMNEQSEVALLLAGPILIAMLGWAPWLLQLLYAPEFAPAASILRWQVLADLLKVISWPIAFVIVAKGQGKTYMVNECLFSAILVAAVWMAIPLVGLKATGIGYFICYLLYLPTVFWLAKRAIGYWPSPSVIWIATLISLCLGVTFAAAEWEPLWGAAVALPLTVGFGLFAGLKLNNILGGGLKEQFNRLMRPRASR